MCSDPKSKSNVIPFPKERVKSNVVDIETWAEEQLSRLKVVDDPYVLHPDDVHWEFQSDE